MTCSQLAQLRATVCVVPAGCDIFSHSARIELLQLGLPSAQFVGRLAGELSTSQVAGDDTQAGEIGAAAMIGRRWKRGRGSPSGDSGALHPGQGPHRLRFVRGQPGYARALDGSCLRSTATPASPPSSCRVDSSTSSALRSSRRAPSRSPDAKQTVATGVMQGHGEACINATGVPRWRPTGQLPLAAVEILACADADDRQQASRLELAADVAGLAQGFCQRIDDVDGGHGRVHRPRVEYASPRARQLLPPALLRPPRTTPWRGPRRRWPCGIVALQPAAAATVTSAWLPRTGCPRHANGARHPARRSTRRR